MHVSLYRLYTWIQKCSEQILYENRHKFYSHAYAFCIPVLCKSFDGVICQCSLHTTYFLLISLGVRGSFLEMSTSALLDEKRPWFHFKSALFKEIFLPVKTIFESRHFL